MFATLPSYSSSSIILLSKNGLFPTRTSKSQCSMSFTARNPSRVTTEAFAGTTSRVDSRKPANLYEVLRIKETASPTEIKTAYRCLAKQYHPDAAAASESESDGRDFIEIHNAYATLSDPTARARYDISIGAGRRFRYAAGNRPGIGHRTRRWETDQCW